MIMEEKFKMVLQKDEEIKWCNKVNVFANILKGLVPAILIGGFISLNLTLASGAFLFSDKWVESEGPYLVPVLYLLPAIIVLYIIYSFLKSRNTFFAITNKRIIRRTGALSNNFIHYTLKNVGTVQVVGSIVDSKNSATLLITTKDFHTDSNGNNITHQLAINSLYNAYEAYNILTEMVEGNNESLRVKVEK